MPKTIVNLTLQAVVTEIETVLDSYPYQPYQQAFAIPDLRQELIAYVLSRIPCTFSAIEEKAMSHGSRFHHHCLEQQLHLESLIHQGICSLLQEKSDWVSNHLPAQAQCGLEPSHWFG